MIALSSRFQTRHFEESDMELLAALASVASLRIRNVALAEEAAERKRMEHELQMARDIQMSVLPHLLPVVDGYSLHGSNIPSRGVSGDYYKAFARKNGQELALMIADVCGKGMAAALLTASLEALSAGPIEDGQEIEEICNNVCRRLYERTPPTKFATAFLCILDVASGNLSYINAGHNPVLVVRSDGAVEMLRSLSVPIGVIPDADFTAEVTPLHPNDLVVLYTDGITEANDPDHNMYGEERLMEFILEHRDQPLDELARIIDADVTAFARGEPFADDRTMVLLRRDPE
jgi:sigma-B regulation protein RsbU (phosphoserine phosphatase)